MTTTHRTTEGQELLQMINVAGSINGSDDIIIIIIIINVKMATTQLIFLI